MNENELVKEFTDKLDDKYRAIFNDLAEYAMKLDYNPVRNKTKTLTVDFRNKKVNKTIMKMGYKEQRHDGFKFGERRIPGLRLKFYATKDYNETFNHAVKIAVEYFDGRFNGCFHCGKCKNEPDGYTYKYSDGRVIFLCGNELVSVFDFENDIEEIKRLMKNQADYFNKLKLGDNNDI